MFLSKDVIKGVAIKSCTADPLSTTWNLVLVGRGKGLLKGESDEAKQGTGIPTCLLLLLTTDSEGVAHRALGGSAG